MVVRGGDGVQQAADCEDPLFRATFAPPAISIMLNLAILHIIRTVRCSISSLQSRITPKTSLRECHDSDEAALVQHCLHRRMWSVSAVIYAKTEVRKIDN